MPEHLKLKDVPRYHSWVLTANAVGGGWYQTAKEEEGCVVGPGARIGHVSVRERV